MSKENKSDREVVASVLSGRAEDFGCLIERYERLIYSFLLTRMKNLQEVEDIAQESFVKAFKHLRSFDCDKKFSSWVVTIARNLMVDQIRKKSRDIVATDLVDSVLINQEDSVQKNPQEVAIRNESFKRISDMIQSLPEDLREPFVLRVVNQISYQEIAEILEIPLQTVKNRIFKARTLLRGKREKDEKLS
ncbi:MAG: RNA polymerase sigma factor [Candidatus Rifleibacteriota bacterium]